MVQAEEPARQVMVACLECGTEQTHDVTAEQNEVKCKECHKTIDISSQVASTDA